MSANSENRCSSAQSTPSHRNRSLRSGRRPYKDLITLNEIPYSSLGIEEHSDEAPRDGRAGATPDPDVVAKPKRHQSR